MASLLTIQKEEYIKDEPDRCAFFPGVNIVSRLGRERMDELLDGALQVLFIIVKHF